ERAGCRTAAGSSGWKGAGAERGYIAARSGNSFGIEDDAIACGITVQVRVNVTLHVTPLTGFKGIDGSNLPVSCHVLHEPVAMFEPWCIVNRSKRQAVAMVQS